MDLCFDEETGEFKEHKEPYCVMPFPTKEDFDQFVEMVNFWNEHHKPLEEFDHNPAKDVDCKWSH